MSEHLKSRTIMSTGRLTTVEFLINVSSTPQRFGDRKDNVLQNRRTYRRVTR